MSRDVPDHLNQQPVQIPQGLFDFSSGTLNYTVGEKHKSTTNSKAAYLLHCRKLHLPRILWTIFERKEFTPSFWIPRSTNPQDFSFSGQEESWHWMPQSRRESTVAEKADSQVLHSNARKSWASTQVVSTGESWGSIDEQRLQRRRRRRSWVIMKEYWVQEGFMEYPSEGETKRTYWR